MTRVLLTVILAMSVMFGLYVMWAHFQTSNMEKTIKNQKQAIQTHETINAVDEIQLGYYREKTKTEEIGYVETNDSNGTIIFNLDRMR